MAFERFKKFNVDDLIAKNPADPRDSSRLMVLNRQTGEIRHQIFRDLPQFINAGDTVVINDSKVFPAKLFAHKETGGKMEVLLVRQLQDKYSWAVLLRQYKPGTKLNFGHDLRGEVISNTENGEAVVKFNKEDIMPYCREYGLMPLPPYIEKARKHAGMPLSIGSDKQRYQTVYAHNEGSIAAPTAGFHFTPQLLDALREKGVNIAYVTLHVGWGTFKPLRTEPEEHTMLAEFAVMPKETAEIINKTKQNGGKLFSVGTTSTRTIESFADDNGFVSPGGKWTDLFIYQGYKFKAVDALITNFHFPDSTPLCMVSAFATEDFIYKAYSQAVELKYRFYSFGDSMLIL